MSAASPLRLRLLLALHLAGSGDAAAIADIAEIDPSVAAPELESLVDADLAVRGRRGVSSSPEGRFLLRRLLRDELELPGIRDGIEEAYAEFLTRNGVLLDVCTAWQLRTAADGTMSPNDHSDAAYDEAVIERLTAVHHDMRGVLDQLAETLQRFDRYRRRLDTALDRLRSGDHDYFTRPMFPSYHSTWFELHEDLLVTLDTTRRHERSQST